MSDSVRIQADENRAVYVGQFDQDIWLSIQVHGGGAHCVIPRDEAYKMLKTLHELLGQMEEI
jgi:hypothetical protein